MVLWTGFLLFWLFNMELYKWGIIAFEIINRSSEMRIYCLVYGLHPADANAPTTIRVASQVGIF